MAQDDDVFEWVIERTGRKLDWERERRAIKEILEGRH